MCACEFALKKKKSGGVMGSSIFIFNKYLYYRVKDCELYRSLSEREGCPTRPSAGLGGQ